MESDVEEQERKKELQSEDTRPSIRTEVTNVYRADVDGLRAVAVTSVLIYHMKADWLPGGFVGVDIFFVISGYVVMGSLMQDGLPLTLDSVIAFYARRLKRLLPAHVTTSVLVGIAMSLLVPPWAVYRSRYYKSGMLALVGLSNNYFAIMKVGYFDAGNLSLQMNPFTHTWSLGVEEQYYIFMPILFVLVYAERLHWPALPAIAFGCVFICSALLSLWLTVNAQKTAFYVLPARFWELMAGAILCQAKGKVSALVNGFGNHAHAALQLAAMVLIIASLIFTREEHGFPFPAAVPAVAGALLFITVGLAPESVLNKVVGWELLAFIGKLSYPIYLLHWPIFVLCRWSCGLDSALTRLASIGALILLTCAVYFLMERPIRSWRPKNVALVFIVSVLAVEFAEICLFALHWNLLGDLYLGGRAPASGGVVNMTIKDNGACQSKACHCIYRIPTLHRPPCAQPRADDDALAGPPDCLENIAPGARGWQGIEFFHEECHLRNPHPNSVVEHLVPKCLTPQRGQNGKKRALFVIGDSHAGMLLSGIRKRFNGSFSVTSYRASGAWCCGFCDPASAPHFFKSRPARLWNPEACRVFSKKITDFLQHVLQPRDIVVVSNLDYWSAEDRHEANIRLVRAKLRELHRVVQSNDALLVLVGPSPWLSDNGFNCVPSAIHPDVARNCEISAQASQLRHSLLHGTYADLERELDGTLLFDIHKLLCDNKTCGAMIPGSNVFGMYDTNHVDRAGSRYLAQFLCSELSTSGWMTNNLRAGVNKSSGLEDTTSVYSQPPFR